MYKLFKWLLRPFNKKKFGTFQCFHCGQPHSVVWDNDEDAIAYGYIEEGIVHTLHCTNCKAEITYFISASPEE